MSTANAKTGPIAVSDGVDTTLRAGRQGDLIVGQNHAKNYEAGYRGGLFNAASQALVTTTVGLATTYTGLVLSNPINSVVNLAILRASLFQSVLQATQPEAVALAVGFNAGTNVTHTTPVTPRSNKIGSGLTPAGLADISATLPTAPFYHTFLQNSASNTTMNGGQIAYIDGSIILIPGAYILFVTPAQASVAGMWFSFDWEEVAV